MVRLSRVFGRPRVRAAGCVIGVRAAVGLVVTLSGCAMLPAPQAPAPMLEYARLGVQEVAQSPAFARAQWWREIDDPVLDQVILAALSASPDLALARARTDAARAAAALAAAEARPAIALGGSFTRERFSADSTIPPPSAGTWINLSGLALELDWRFDFWGATRHRVAAALGRERGARLEAASVERLIETAAASQYFLWRSAAQRADLKARDTSLAAAELELAQSLVEAGLAPAAAIDAARASLAHSRAQLAAARSEWDVALAGLAALTARAPRDWQDATGDGLPDWRLDAEPWQLDRIAARPELLAARARVEAATEAVSAARADFYPDLSLSALAGFSARQIGDLLTSRSRSIAIAPAFKLPVFEGGSLRARLGISEADARAAVAQYNRTLLAVIQEASVAHSRWQAAGAIHHESRQAAVASARLQSAANERLAAGLASRAAVLGAARQSVTAQLAESEAMVALLLSQVALVRAAHAATTEVPSSAEN